MSDMNAALRILRTNRADKASKLITAEAELVSWREGVVRAVEKRDTLEQQLAELDDAIFVLGGGPLVEGEV